MESMVTSGSTSMNGGKSLRKRLDYKGVDPKLFCKRSEGIGRDTGRRRHSTPAANGGPAAGRRASRSGRLRRRRGGLGKGRL